MENILIVDDEEMFLQSIKRVFRKKIPLTLMTSAVEALELMKTQEFAVVVSDMNMPIMDGLEFLSIVTEKYPNVQKIMLTGNGEVETASNAVNRGKISSFLRKPCPPEKLLKAILECIQKYQIHKQELDLIEKTTVGSIKIISELIFLSNPLLSSLSEDIVSIIGYISDKFLLSNAWQYKIAANFCLLGLVSLEKDNLLNQIKGLSLENSDKFYHDFVSTGGEMIAHLPKLGNVSTIITSLNKRDDELSFLEPELRDGVKLLQVALDFVFLIKRGYTQKNILISFEKQDKYLHKNIKVLWDYEIVVENTLEEISVSDVRVGMKLKRDVCSSKGLLLIPKETIVNGTVLKLLSSFAAKDKMITNVLVELNLKESL